MFLRKHWFGLSFLFVCGVIVSLFFILQPTPKAPIKIYKPVEPLEKPTAQVPEGDTSQGGHFHADGTWHGEPHDAPVESQPIVGEVSQGGHWSDAYLPPMEELEVKYADDPDAMFIIDKVKILLKHKNEGFSGHDPDVDKAFADLMNFTNKKISSLGKDVSEARLYELMRLTWRTLDNPPSYIDPDLVFDTGEKKIDLNYRPLTEEEQAEYEHLKATLVPPEDYGVTEAGLRITAIGNIQRKNAPAFMESIKADIIAGRPREEIDAKLRTFSDIFAD